MLRAILRVVSAGLVLALPSPAAMSQGGGATLTAAPAELALDAGGVQVLALATAPPAAGATVLLLGTLSGPLPGVPLGGGLVLPLNPDAYFLHSLAHPDPPLAGALQVLDASGTATATFKLPPATWPSLAGLVAHHAFVVVGGGGALLDVSNAAPLAFVPTKTVWTVDAEEPADFKSLAAALATPAVKNGDTLLVSPNAGSSFTLTKALGILAPSGEAVFAPDVVVSGAAEFTLAGVHARTMVIENVPGRGVLDDCRVGTLHLDDHGGIYYLGELTIEGCDQVLIANGWFHGDDACYPEADDAGPAVVVRSSRVVFADCTIQGGYGAGEGCEEHYPTAGNAIHASADSDVTLTGTTAVGGVGPWDTTMAALQAEVATVRVRGDASDLLTATAPSPAIQGFSATATVSGVTVSGAPLPPWVIQPGEAEPFLRLEGPVAIGTTPPAYEIRAHGPAGGAMFVVVALAPPPPPLVEPLWFDLASVIALLSTTTLGQDVPVVLPWPAIPALAGTTPIVQGWMPLSPAGIQYVTSATCAVVRW